MTWRTPVGLAVGSVSAVGLMSLGVWPELVLALGFGPLFILHTASLIRAKRAGR